MKRLSLLLFLLAFTPLVFGQKRALSAYLSWSSEDINAVLITTHRWYVDRHTWEMGLRTVLDHKVLPDEEYVGRGLSGIQDRMGLVGRYAFYPMARGKPLTPFLTAAFQVHTYKIFHQQGGAETPSVDQVDFPHDHRHYLFQTSAGVGAEVLFAPNVYVSVQTTAGFTPVIVDSGPNLFRFTGAIQLGVTWDMPGKK